MTGQRETEWDEVKEYVSTSSCQMAYLRGALDDPVVEPCGRCENCVGEPLLDVDVDQELVVRATRHIRTSEMPLSIRKLFVKDGFPTYEFRGRIQPELQAKEGRILSRWGDAGWGTMVAEDKHAGHFRDELVAAVVEMVQERWGPEPQPEWVTCVPSSRVPTLVPDFGRRLAKQLGIPFVDSISKIRANERQRFQENSYHRCKNLDGAFEVGRRVPQGPVFLVDGIVDSGWTMTVLAALLRQAGAGPVFPLALATTSAGN